MEQNKTTSGTEDFWSIGIASYQHALISVIKLPYQYHSNKFKDVQRTALIEAWCLNMRLLIEFFGIGGNQVKGQQAKDFKASHFLDLQIRDEVADELNKLWEFFSQQVIHLSKKRAQMKNGYSFDLGLPNLERLSNLLLSLSLDFQSTLTAIDSPYAQLVDAANASAVTYLNYGRKSEP